MYTYLTILPIEHIRKRINFKVVCLSFFKCAKHVLLLKLGEAFFDNSPVTNCQISANRIAIKYCKFIFDNCWFSQKSFHIFREYFYEGFNERYILFLIVCFVGLILFSILVITVTSCSELRLVLGLLNFCRSSVAVIGLRMRYLRTASSEIPESLQIKRRVNF